VGTVTIFDIAGNPTVALQAAIIGSGWLALPAGACLGGYTWEVSFGSGEVIEIDGGVIGEQDSVGLWQLPPAKVIYGPPFSAWTEGQPLRWQSILSGSQVSQPTVHTVAEQRYVTEVAVTTAINEPGVFVQGDRVVGWTFGATESTGYLWRGLDSEKLVYEISVYDYYRMTFENSREEQLILAVAQSDEPAWAKLSAFADAFLRPPALSLLQTPRHLRPEVVIPVMRALIAKLLQTGRTQEVVDAFNARTLSAAGDGPLIVEVVAAARDSYGFDVAEQLIREVQDELGSGGGTVPTIVHGMHRQLYRQWLAALVRSGEFIAARQVYARGSADFPDDPFLRLLGVELALAESDWRTAERLLSMQNYPAELTGQVKILEEQLAARKSEQGKVVVRFAPGARQIPVVAVLGGSFEQKFLVDTGASMVTIPWSTAQKLGLRIDRRAAKRTVFTAGGAVDAYEVVLPSIRLGDAEQRDIKALVMDLPNQPDTGLLGLNYLNRFRVNMNSKSGELVLAPR
jgi:clan AA aspartic protease (TIGR02281 family)